MVGALARCDGFLQCLTWKASSTVSRLRMAFHFPRVRVSTKNADRLNSWVCNMCLERLGARAAYNVHSNNVPFCCDGGRVKGCKCLHKPEGNWGSLGICVVVLHVTSTSFGSPLSLSLSLPRHHPTPLLKRSPLVDWAQKELCLEDPEFEHTPVDFVGGSPRHWRGGGGKGQQKRQWNPLKEQGAFKKLHVIGLKEQ